MKSRLLGALLTGVNRAHPYLPEKDVGMEEHIDSLYRISHISPPSVSTQALMLLFHLAVGSKNDSDSIEGEKTQDSSRKDRFYRALYSKIGDPAMLVGRQLTLFFNLVYKGMKNDTNSLRVVAFGKRLLHVAFHYSPSIVSGVLFLLSEVMKHQSALKNCAFSADGNQISFDPLKREPSSAFFRSNFFQDETEKDNKEETGNGIATTPANLWEISLTLHHYHPSVNKFSSSMSEIVYGGDPLRDFTLVQFLDKFAFRNPKSSKKIGNKLMRGESIGERRSGLEGNHHALSSLPMNDPSLLKPNNKISEREEFFHKFFIEKTKRDELKGIVKGNGDEEDFDPLGSSESAAADYDWDDTDDEEEAFVQGLAESLMQGAAGEDSKVDYDDEDPDMDDWSDADSSIVDANNSDSDEFAKGGNNDDLHSDEGSDKNSIEEDESINDGLQLMLEDEDERENSVQESNDELDDPRQKKDQEVSSSFADASNYEVLIENALSKESGKKRTITSDTEDDKSQSTSKPKKKRRNKKRRRNKQNSK